MKKIIVFYAKYGGGHLSAAKSITEYIEKNYKDNTEIKLIDCMFYINKFINKISTKAYSDMAKKAPKLWGKLYAKSEKGLLAKISTDSNKLMAKKLNKLLIDENPDLIISAHPFSSQMCGYLKKKGKLNCTIATIMTDHAPHDQWLVFNEYIDFIFVSNEKMKQKIIEKGIPENKIFATGIPISQRFLLNYDKTKIINEFNLSENKKTILFFGGGAFGLGKEQTLNIFKTFLETDNNLQIIAISGKNKKMNLKFEEITKSLNREKDVKIIEYSTQIPELMSISDLVVTKPGGLTTSESLASNLPLLVINPIPGQEEENASFLEENNAAIWLKDTDNAKTIIKNLLEDANKLSAMKESSSNLSKRNATHDICEILLNTKKA